MPLCTRRSVDREVLDAGFSVNEVSVVLGIEHRLFDVISRKGDYRVATVPEADRQELCAVAFWSMTSNKRDRP